METSNRKPAVIPPEILEEARELAAFAEVLPGIEALAAKLHAARQAGRKLRVKLGVDPTGSDLHLGHAVVLRLVRRFQDRGHQAVLVIGGFTATIGDPTGRDTTRPPLTPSQVAANAATYIAQAGRVLDVSTLEVFNNAGLGELRLCDLVPIIATASLNQVLQKDGFGDRLKDGKTLTFMEALYPFLQANDSVRVEADIEVGGSDQRFNVLMGRQMQSHFGKEPQVAMLMPILEGTDGVRKMSKSFGNTVGLTDDPVTMFGKVMRIPDALIVRYTELVTLLQPSQIQAAKDRLAAKENPMVLKREAATQVVRFIHGNDAAREALEQWDRVHRDKQIPLEMPSHVVLAPTALVDVMVACSLAQSKGQARKFIEGGGVRLDGGKVDDVAMILPVPPSIGTVLSHGRRSFVRLVPA